MIFFKSFTRPRAICFDLDDTLYDNTVPIAAAERYIREFAGRHYLGGRTLSPEEYAETKAAVIRECPELAADVSMVRYFAAGTISAAIVTFVIGVIIVGQVQLTELNQDIITAQATLADTESIYTQNQMKVEANLSNAEIEKYATETLGMTKASNAQKEFVAIEEGDKAEVSAADNGNIFTRFFESIFNLWS